LLTALATAKTNHHSNGVSLDKMSGDGPAAPTQDHYYLRSTLRRSQIYPQNVSLSCYTFGMKKLGKANEARRKAESQALFREMMKNPHLVSTPEKYKGTRQSNKSKAIRESLD
jgi:hypothetical protein